MLDVDEYLNNATHGYSAADSYETYIGVELNFPDSDGNPVRVVVRKRINNNDGDPVGVVRRNPILNTSRYEVQYLDGFVEEMTSNQIADNMLSQVDSVGNHFLLIQEINDHCIYYSVINNSNDFLTRKSVKLYENKTNIWWTLQVE